MNNIVMTQAKKTCLFNLCDMIPLQAWSCWVRTLRISFTQADLISVVGA